jgi:hypothetical protein
VLEDFEGRRTDRGDRGYTPFEYIEFTRVPVKHEVTAVVGRGVAECYRAWADRLNWMAWFDEIDEVGFHEEEPTFVSMYLWYRWGEFPRAFPPASSIGSARAHTVLGRAPPNAPRPPPRRPPSPPPPQRTRPSSSST